EAGRLAAATLLEGGCHRPAVMGAAHVSYTARCRQDAFIAECRLLGLEPLVLPIKANAYDSGYASAEALRQGDVDGVFCVNDYLACGVIDRLARDFGMKLPDDIRIIGHDDIPQAGWAAYRLTTLLQPCDIQAEQAIDLLTSRIERSDMAGRVEYTPVSL